MFTVRTDHVRLMTSVRTERYGRECGAELFALNRRQPRPEHRADRLNGRMAASCKTPLRSPIPNRRRWSVDTPQSTHGGPETIEHAPVRLWDRDREIGSALM